MAHKRHPPFEEVQASRDDYDQSKIFVQTKTPMPEWKPGGGLNHMEAAKDFLPTVPFKSINPSDHEPGAIYKLMISGITPRPIAFVSTLSSDGVSNLAPMSYFAPCGHNPPTIMVSISATSSGKKDTAKNILDTREFCVSIISEPFLEAANYTSVDAPEGVSEWDLCGLTPRASTIIKPSHPAESAFTMECTLSHHHTMLSPTTGEPSGTVFLGEVKQFHVKESVLDANDPGLRVMMEKLRPVGRLGGISYGLVHDGCEIPRSVWEKVKDTPEVKAVLEKKEQSSKM